jgi:hypothetical protein
MIQIDTLCHKIPNFMKKGETGRCYRTGEHQPGQSGGGEKAPEQNHRISQDAARLEGARHPDDRGVYPGFPADTPKTIRRDIAIIQDELPIDLLEFFCLTPLPGSEDHQVLWKNKCPATLSCSSWNGQCRRVRRRIY